MKKSILMLTAASLFAIGSVTLVGCGSSEQSNSKEHEHATGMYVCPMHPEIAGEKGDRCSKCKMDLVLKEHGHDASDGHSHEHDSHASSGHMQHMNEVRELLKEELGDKYDQPAPPATDDQMALGKETYIGVCANCHGESGKGDGPTVGTLKSKPADFTDNAHSKFYSDQGRIHIIKNGVEGTPMAGWGAILGEEKVSAVYAYVRSLRSSEEVESKGHSHHGEDHAHGSPHGGVVKTAGDYHIEMVVGEGEVSYYLLDGEEKSIPNADVTGTVILQFDDETLSDKLTPKGGDHFTLELKEGASPFTSIVSFVVNGKTVVAKFQKESQHDHEQPEEHHGDHGHHH